MQELQNIKYGSCRKTALYYLRMKNQPVEFSRIFNFVKHYGQRPSRFMESLVSMQSSGLIEEVRKDVWQITQFGIQAVYELGKRDRGRDGSRGLDD